MKEGLFELQAGWKGADPYLNMQHGAPPWTRISCSLGDVHTCTVVLGMSGQADKPVAALSLFLSLL